jgi:hypothetical protein
MCQEATSTALSSAESRIEKLERGSHLRVHGSTTGIPMNEVSIVTAPQRSASPAPVVAGYANRNADISVLLKDGC